MENSRDKIIIRTSMVGIGANVMLAGFKAGVGVVTNSIAITLDAINNLSDALSSIITIIGTKLAGKKADKKHPFGYGRVEYLSAMVIALIILYAGITSLVESVKKIINPNEPEYGAVSVMVLIAAIAVKIVMGLYVKKKGEEVNSDSLVASGKDALMDSVITFATLVAAGLYMLVGVGIEGFLGVIISILIIKAGAETLGDTTSSILGERIDGDIVAKIRKLVAKIPGVLGVYDIILNNYGPDRFIGSLHVEVEDDLKAIEIDKLERMITERVLDELGVLITAVGIYPSNDSEPEIRDIRKKIHDYMEQYPEVLQVHGLYCNKEDRVLSMDVVIDYNVSSRHELFDKIEADLKQMFDKYEVRVIMDVDASL